MKKSDKRTKAVWHRFYGYLDYHGLYHWKKLVDDLKEENKKLAKKNKKLKARIAKVG